ncbi:MAG: hypothetical protein FJ009_03145 [Chloroflexi bacterium]|nr:hypothetical protein [Chloroflexota bacterium]
MYFPLKYSASQTFRRIQGEGGGANIYIIIGLAFGFLLLTPFFLNFSSLYITRRSSQNGADAASLAAAEFFAEILSYSPSLGGKVPFPHNDYYKGGDLDGNGTLGEGDCRRIDAKQNNEAYLKNLIFRQRYLARIYGALISNQTRGTGTAQFVADQNNTSVVPGTFQLKRCGEDCENRAPLDALVLSLITSRGYVPAVGGYTGASGMPVRAQASSEIYNYPFDGLIRYVRHTCAREEIERTNIYDPTGKVIGVKEDRYKTYLFYLEVAWKARLISYRGVPYPD